MPSDPRLPRGVSPESIGFRFFGDAESRLGNRLVGRRRLRGSLRAGGREREPALGRRPRRLRRGRRRASAEVAFLVADAWQGQGISTILLAHLADVADRHGISTFTAEVLPANHRMIEVFRESGFPVEMRSTPDAIELELPTSLSPEALERFEERERTAAVAAVRSFLEPRSVAVIGASRQRGTIGGEMLHNLLAVGFNGRRLRRQRARRRRPVAAGLPLRRRHPGSGRAGRDRRPGRRRSWRWRASARPPACARCS